jgi:hypothetical protein
MLDCFYSLSCWEATPCTQQQPKGLISDSFLVSAYVLVCWLVVGLATSFLGIGFLNPATNCMLELF